MHPTGFQCSADDEASIAEAIERDAAMLGPQATLGRYLGGIAGLADMPVALEAAVVAALRAQPGDALAAAQKIAEDHPDLADLILGAALGLGLSGDAGEFAEGSLLFGRFRIVEMLGAGATARTARAKDELLTTPELRVEALVKRYDDAVGADARVHAVREARMLLAAPPGLAPRPIALHAAVGEPAYLVTEFLPSRAASSVDDIVRALPAVLELQAAGICHGDLKPEHIRITDDGSAMFIDFGSAVSTTAARRGEDLARLAACARGFAKTRLERSLTAAGERNARGGRVRRGAMALRLASRAWRRRAAASVAKVGAAFLLAAAIGAVAGWLSRPPESKVALSMRALHALNEVGRLGEARIHPSGEIASTTLEIPELTELGDQKVYYSRGLRFFKDGRVELNLIDPKDLPNLPSPNLPSGH